MKDTTSAYGEKESIFFDKFAKFSNDNHMLATKTMELMRVFLWEKDVKVVCDYGCGGGEHTPKIKTLWAKKVIAVDNSVHQIKISLDNNKEPAFLYTKTVNSFEDEIDAVFAKHVFVSMSVEQRKEALKELSRSMTSGAILTIAETNLEEHVKWNPDKYEMAMQTGSEAYPAMIEEDIVDGASVATVLKLESDLDKCEEGITKWTLSDKMHTVAGMKRLAGETGFKFEAVKYIDTKDVKKAYVVYIFRKY